MSQSLGRTSIDGSFSVADISTLSISTGRVIENTVGASITTYKVKDTQDAGGILLASGNYANPLTPSTGTIGEANTASNEGDGAGLVMAKSGVNLPFKTIKVIGGTITEDADSITIEIGSQMLKTVSLNTFQVTAGSSVVVTPTSTQKVCNVEISCAAQSNLTWNFTTSTINLNPSLDRILDNQLSGDDYSSGSVSTKNISGTNGQLSAGIGEAVTFTAGSEDLRVSLQIKEVE